MSDRPEGPTGSLDISTLELLARRAATHPLVVDWGFRPDSLAPRVLELRIDEAQYSTRSPRSASTFAGSKAVRTRYTTWRLHAMRGGSVVGTDTQSRTLPLDISTRRRTLTRP
ncbi:hypothetical protein [Haloprofundus salilacus]|uniref:hypothetical protein n=1 Tax=Haloprofundus salilacus TaxID=2876190 RepID=UPI001CCD8C99|nr:hypothetical protein [Haloprofundus salilacus]